MNNELIGTICGCNKFDDVMTWSNKPIIFWGCGNTAYVVRKALLNYGIQPTVYCDSNSSLWGKYIDGVEVISYEQVKERFSEYRIFITTAIGSALEIVKYLKETGEANEIIHVERPFKVDDGFLEGEYLRSNSEKFQQVYEMLEDELSKEIYVENIKFRMSGNKLPLIKYVDGDSFFDEKLFDASGEDCYVDVGAYTGDTILRFYAFCRGKYSVMYAVEPDVENIKGLQNLIKLGQLENIHIFPVGGWDSKAELTFYTAKNKYERGFASPNFLKSMKEMMPGACNIGEEDFVEEKLLVDTVDNLLDGKECSVLKINALAADFQVLRGSRKTIEKYYPTIVGEFGTRRENLADMILCMKEMNPNYKIYLREKKIFGDYKTVFTAVDARRRVNR